MSDYFNPLRDGGMNSVEDNTAALVRGAQSAVSVPAQRKEYAPKKPLAIPRTFTMQKQPVPMPNQDLQTASAPEAVPDAGISPDTEMPSRENYWSRKSAEASALADIRARNAEHYNAVLPEHVYSAMNEQFKAVAREKGLSAAEEERARYMNAWQYHRLYGIPFSDALENLDEYNRAIFGADTDGMTYKGKMERLGDAWTSGMNSLRRSSLGKSLLNAELRGDDEGARLAWEAIDALDAENNTLAVSQPQSVGMSILTAGIQSLPYTAAAMGAGIVSGLVGLGPLGSFAAGYDLMMHDEYISLRQAGADVETAQSVAAVSGVLQAAVESGLGVVARGAVQGAKSAGKKAVGNLTEKARKALTDRITKDIFTRYKMGGLAAAMASRFATDHVADTVEEGVEEYMQEWISGLSRHLADAMSDNDVESDDLGTIARNALESFKGGIYGAVLLGVGDAAFGAYGTVSDYKNLRAAAEFIPSKEAFRKATSDNAAFAGMSDDEKTRVQDEIFSSFEAKREQKASDEAAAIAEVNADEEGLEQTVFSDDGTEAEPAAEYRTDDGRLYVDNKVTAEDGNGLSEGVYRAGDPTRDGGNGYGYIKYTLDENEGKVTVETFAMSRSREELRDELFRSFASDFSGYDIEWDAKLGRARAIRDRLISGNPRGKGAGLNYYASATNDDAETRLSIARQLADNIPSLNAGERIAAVAFIESIARGLYESVSEFYERTFGDKIFGDAGELAQAAEKTGQSVRGGMGYRQFGKDIRAVIYAGEKADFSTWVHEVAHAVRGRLSGDLLKQAEKAFGVTDGKWTEAQEEKFAYGLEDFLRTGRAKSSELKNLYQKLAELISRIYGAMKERIQFSKDIEDTYNALLQGDDSVLARAEEAVRRADDEAEVKKRAESPMQDSNDSSGRMAQRIKEAAGNVMADPDAGTQEKTDAVLNTAGMAYDDEVMDLGDFIFQKSRAEDAESTRQMEAVRQQYQGTDGWMKAPNGKPTNLTEKQWLQVRTPNFKRWFGDWEAGHKARQIIGDSPINLADNELSNLTGSEQRTKAAEIYNALVGKEPVRTVDGRNVVFTRTGFKELKSHSANPHTLQIVPKLQEIVSTATPFLSEKNTDQTKPNVKAFHSYARKILLSEGEYIARVVLREDNDGTIFYDGEATELQKVEELRQPDRKPNAGENLQTPLKNKVMQFFADVNSNDVSKVVDENGEPKIVKHGTPYTFSTFSKKKIGSTTDAGWLGTGFYFYGNNEAYAQQYANGGVVLDTFLNICNPYFASYSEFEHLAEVNDREESAAFSEQLQEDGYDGVFFNEDYNEEWVAFEPAQIKSATDNTGAFDPHNPSILFQTEAELVESARQFGSWQDFMEYYEAGRDEGFLNPDEYSQVPQGADAEWYQTTWELANNAGTALSDDINTRRTKAAEEFSRDGTPEEMDALFTAHLASDPTLLDDFLRRVNELLTEEPTEHPQDEAEAAANERLLQMKRYIRTQLRHGSFVSNAQRLSGGKPLTQRARNTIMTLIRRAARDYRAIYAEVMDDDFFRVDEADTVTARLKAAGLHDLTAGEGIEDASPEERRRIARKIQNERIAAALADGSFKIDSNLEAYIADLGEQVKEGRKALAELKERTDEDWQRMSGWQERRILETYDRLLAARAKYDLKSDSVAHRAESVAKTGEKYRDNRYDGIRADYESVFRQWNDLLKITKMTEEMRAAVQRREDLYRLRERQKEKKSEHDAVQQLKDYRKRLVKRAFRRVPFERIDYESARTLIAVQRIFHPNMTGGVNRWIGTEGRWAREVWGSFHTDADERERIISILSLRKAGPEIIKKLEDTKTGEDFDKWTKKDRQRLYRAMSSDNWVRRLNLLGLEKEREESIQLDIRIDDAGRVRVGEDVEKMARDALGSDMYDAIVNRPFAEWTTEDMEAFARKVDDIYVRGRNLLAARRQLEHERAAELRRKIEEAVQNTGIVINDDDPEDVKEKKRSEISRRLGKTSEVKGTAADRYRRQGIWNRLTQSYHDANIRRVARLLDNQGEGVNTALLYWRENDCFNAEERSKRRRIARIESAMKNAGISLPELYEKVVIDDFRGDGAPVTFTVDELLYYAMANRDEMSRDACMYGSMIDEKDRQKYRLMDEEDRKMRGERTKKRDEALAAGDEETARALSAEMAAEVDENGMHIPEGTAAYKEDCLVLWNKVLDAADEVLKRDGGKFRQFAEAISDDYTEEFDRIQEVSIAEFNQPVNRVDNYVPLIRKAYSGDTNENRVRADLKAESEEKLSANLSRLRAENALLDARERMSDEEVSARAHEGVTDADEWERLAVIHADDKTRLCQPSNRSVDLAPMFKNGSEVQKALLQFTASLNVIWQNLRYDIPYAVRQKQYRQVVGIIAGYAAAGIALGCLAGDDGDDDDEARTVRNFIWTATTQFTDAVPIIGAVATSTAEKLITGHASFSRGTDLFPALTKYLSAAKEVTDGRWSKAAGHFAEGMGLTFGLPVSGAKEALYVAGIGDGKDGLSFHPTAVMGRRPK